MRVTFFKIMPTTLMHHSNLGRIMHPTEFHGTLLVLYHGTGMSHVTDYS